MEHANKIEKILAKLDQLTGKQQLLDLEIDALREEVKSYLKAEKIPPAYQESTFNYSAPLEKEPAVELPKTEQKTDLGLPTPTDVPPIRKSLQERKEDSAIFSGELRKYC